MFTHQRPDMPSRYSRPSASTTVESLPETITSCCCSSCRWGTIGWMTLARSCRTTDGRSGVGMEISSGLARGPLALEARARREDGTRRPGRRDRPRGRGRHDRHAGRVERGLLDAAEALPGELDEVVAHHRGLD